MLDYITVGANDIELSIGFYDALLIPLGYVKKPVDDHAEYSLIGPDNRNSGPGTVYVKKPFDGGPATAGNGMMLAFSAPDDAKVRQLHAAGILAGGSDEGAPGTRSYYGPRFYVAYLRDPVGNKVALFTVLDKQS